MTDYLAEWISERPALIETLKNHRQLERLLRVSPPKRVSTPEMEREWQGIVSRLQT